MKIQNLGIVVIGRNEGERLTKCLTSAVKYSQNVVYVDSGSTDNSLDVAHSLNVSIVELDMSVPFTAARARNTGWQYLASQHENITYIQFVDGDCELVAGWLDDAVNTLNHHEDCAAVCGRRRERYPERSLYNRLCDIEWDSQVGPINSFGGDVLIRLNVLSDLKGYDESFIAGEEPEFCVRIKAAKYSILRIDSDMTMHDAAIYKFSQWWNRAKRAGHAYAQGKAKHGHQPINHNVKQVRSTLVWGGLFILLFSLLCFWLLLQGTALFFGISPPIILLQSLEMGIIVQGLGFAYLSIKVTYDQIKRQRTLGMATIVGISTALAKIPGFFGIGLYELNRRQHTSAKLIEYK